MVRSAPDKLTSQLLFRNGLLRKQFILEGEEIIDVVGIAGLAVDRPYREEKDVIKYKDPGSGPGNRIRLRAGEAAVFFPEDGHMPGQAADASSLVRKTVIKVPVAA